ncbi:MAG: ESPR domain-containing protein [Gammaproteobacteria bacterium]|nr:ESPR domain-containing protein [Gammaproteobacteria bacterium]
MNKHCYKVIFSKRRNCLVVVSELAQNSGKGERSIGASRQSSFFDTVYQGIHRLSVGLLLGLGLVTLSIPAYATISEDGHAPRNQQPMIVVTASGVPQINIQTPTPAGVSIVPNHSY